MKESDVVKVLEKRDYQVENVTLIPTASGSRELFEVQLVGYQPLIARFAGAKELDPQYNSPVTLGREAANYQLLRDATRLPVPRLISESASVDDLPFQLVTKLPGMPWRKFLELTNYSKNRYINSMTSLGADIAEVERLEFSAYGNAVGEEVRDGVASFADRLRFIFGLKLEKAKPVLPEGEFNLVEAYFKKGVAEAAEQLAKNGSKPVFVMTNLHPTNFLVDARGNITGYSDLKFSQAGVPALEMYNFGLQLFSYFDQATFEEVRKVFYASFEENGGKYDSEDPVNRNLEALLCAGHTLSAVYAYHGAKDGLRDTWSQRFKDLLFQVMDKGEMDYVAFADIIREKTKQPKQPSLP